MRFAHSFIALGASSLDDLAQDADRRSDQPGENRVQTNAQNPQSFVRGEGSPRRRSRRQRVGGTRRAPMIFFYPLVSNFYTFLE